MCSLSRPCRRYKVYVVSSCGALGYVGFGSPSSVGKPKGEPLGACRGAGRSVGKPKKEIGRQPVGAPMASLRGKLRVLNYMRGSC